MNQDYVGEQEGGSLQSGGSLGKASKWAAFIKWSTTGKIMVFLFDSGRPVTKSGAMWEQDLPRTGTGCSGPA